MSLPAISSLSLHPVVPTAAPKKKAKTGSSSGASRRPPPGLNDEHNAEWLKIDQYLDELQNDATPLRERLQTLDSFFDYLVGATEDLTVDDYERRMKCADRQDVIDLLDSISPNVKCEDPAQDDAAKGHVLLMLRFYREVYSDKVGKDGHFEIGPGMLDFCLRTMDNHVDLVAAAQAARILHQLIETAIDKTLVYTNDPTVAPAGLEELVRLYVSEHRLCERIGLQFKAIREQGQERAGLLRNWSLTDGPGAPYMEFCGAHEAVRVVAVLRQGAYHGHVTQGLGTSRSPRSACVGAFRSGGAAIGERRGSSHYENHAGGAHDPRPAGYH